MTTLKKAKSIGIIPRGTKVKDEKGSEFTLKKDVEKELEEDGKQHFFEHGDSKYWVDTDKIEDLKEQELPEDEEEEELEEEPAEEEEEAGESESEQEEEEETEEEEKEETENEEEGDFEYKKHMHKSLGKKRTEMPQIDEESMVEVLIHFASEAKIKKVKKKLKTLKPTQGEINEEKVLGILQKKENKPVKYIISLDGFLLDAHHRWAAEMEKDPDEEVDCYRISLPIKNLLSRANRLKVTTKKDIDDNKVEKKKSKK